MAYYDFTRIFILAEAFIVWGLLYYDMKTE